MSQQDLNRQLAEALGLPRMTTRAVLTLEAGELPTLSVETIAQVDARRYVGQGPMDVAKLKRVPFILRLELASS